MHRMKYRIVPASGETLDALICGDLHVFQKKRGYRFSVDAYLIASFVEEGAGSSILEIGSGSGVISIMLAGVKGLIVTGVEVQPELVEMSRRSVVLNRLEDRVKIVNSDIKEFKGSGFDAVVTNPPYRPAKTGRINPDTSKAISRHEILVDLKALLLKANQALKPGGHFYIVYPAWRMVDLIYGMRESRIEPKVIRMIHPNPRQKAELCLVRGVKDAGAEVVFYPPFFIHNLRSGYTREMKQVFERLSMSKKTLTFA